MARKTITLELDAELLADAAKLLGTSGEAETVNAALEVAAKRTSRDRVDSSSFPALTREHLEHMREHGDE